MNYEYWLDIVDFYKQKGIHTSDWILHYLYLFGKQIHFPNIRFWAITLLSIVMGVKIYDDTNGIWTVEGCFQEIEELLNNKEGDNP